MGGTQQAERTNLFAAGTYQPAQVAGINYIVEIYSHKRISYQAISPRCLRQSAMNRATLFGSSPLTLSTRS